MPGINICNIGVPFDRLSWQRYWATRYISALSVNTTSDTTQTITATIVGTGFDGVSYEYSTDGVNYSVKGTAVGGTYNAIGLTAGTLYYWRARLYKGTHYGRLLEVVSSDNTYSHIFSDALFYINGNIIDVGGTKYFQDKTANARNFLITKYDFDSTWIKGFPYKSSATISAPAADATLIAADLNNYLYDSGGTPNAIPVISLFQNIDYENKLFCKHAAKVVDGNGVETYEPRVIEIVGYTNVKSGADLITCQTYFSVPAILDITAARWVSKAAINDDGSGIPADPFLTIEGAYKYLPDGYTIYVKSGIYTEQYNGTSIRYFYADKDAATIKFIAIGRVEIRTINSSYVLRQVAGNTEWTGFMFNAEAGKDNSIINFYAGNTNSCILTKCKLYGVSAYQVYSNTGAGINTFEAYNSLFTCATSLITVDSCILRGCHINATVSKCTTYEYNKCIISLYEAAAAVSYATSVRFNYFQTKGNILDNTTTGGAVVCKYNIIDFVWTADVGINLYLINVDSCTPDISNNKITSNDLAISRIITFIRIGESVTLPVIESNILYSASLVNVSHICFTVGAGIIGKAKVNYNYIHCNSTDEVVINFGGESTVEQKLNTTEIIGNTFIGSLLENPTEDVGAVHFVLANAGIDYIIKLRHIQRVFCNRGGRFCCQGRIAWVFWMVQQPGQADLPAVEFGRENSRLGRLRRRPV